MTAYFDNDIIHKLAACDLTAIALAVLDISDPIVLPTTKYKFLLKDPVKGEKRYGAIVHQRISALIRSASEIAEEPDNGEQDLLTGIHDIDQGEAILFSFASRNPNAVLVTGDKRSLIALAGDASCASIVSRLEGRVLCFEQVVRGAIDSTDFQTVCQRVAPAVACDKTMQVVFSQGVLTSEVNAQAALKSYIDDLRRGTGGLLSQRL